MKTADSISRKIAYNGASDGDMHDAMHCDLPKDERKRIKKAAEAQFRNAGPVAKAFFGLFDAQKEAAEDEAIRHPVRDRPVVKSQSDHLAQLEADLLAVARGQQPSGAYMTKSAWTSLPEAGEWAAKCDALSAADAARQDEPRPVMDLTTGKVLNVSGDYERHAVSGGGMSRSW